ncbi:hypothetical protein [Moorena sp. SIO3A2]|uniref:hypothetical protein n=1 Tax=Moorena sp. SIO3A2 TaxID=2607841 RepID=UPI0013BBAB8C|nr:hypothetical protein [Moorena sp. SIO3A2]NER86548.1 hypothetical protein [Moorena sp. SIO3A2]
MFLGTGNLTVSIQLSAISHQPSAISYQSSANALQMVLLEMLLNKRCRGATRGELNYGSNAPLRSWGGSAVLGRQRGLGEAARSWGGSAVLGRQRGLGGFPHERLPWFPP